MTMNSFGSVFSEAAQVVITEENRLSVELFIIRSTEIITPPLKQQIEETKKKTKNYIAGEKKLNSNKNILFPALVNFKCTLVN